MKVRNATSTTLGLPNAKPVAPGGSTNISDAVAHNKVVAAWIDRGMLVIEGDQPTNAAPESEVDDSGMTKDQLIAELADYGVTRDKRTSEENLAALLEEVRAEREAKSETEVE